MRRWRWRDWEVSYRVVRTLEDGSWETVLETVEIVSARTEREARLTIHDRWEDYIVLIDYSEEVEVA